jgi:hypothetical protein
MCYWAFIQIDGMASSGQNQKGSRYYVPFWKAVVRKILKEKQLKEKDALPVLSERAPIHGKEDIAARRSSFVKIIRSKLSVATRDSKTIAEEVEVSESASTVEKDDSHDALPILSERALTHGKRDITIRRPSFVKIIHSKPSVTVRDSKTIAEEGEVSESASTVEEDDNYDAFSVFPEMASIYGEEDIAFIPDEDERERLPIPAGYRLCDVPGDGLCGYWATFTAKKAEEVGDEASIRVEKKEIFELLGRLSDRIAHTLKRENKTDMEMEMVSEIDQLLRDGYAKDYEDLYGKIEKGQLQLDSPLTIFLAQEVGYNIIVEWKGTKDGKNICVQERYQVDDGQGTIIIYYSGNGSGGHYQAIIPSRISVVFNRET